MKWQALPQEDWASVPSQVATLYQDLAPVARQALRDYQGLPGQILIDPQKRAQYVAAIRPEHRGWITIKPAALLSTPHRWFTTAESLLGGPSATTKALVGGLFGSGLGYVTGRAAEHLLPRAHFPQRRKLRRALALAGGLAGASPGLWDLSILARTPPGHLPGVKQADDWVDHTGMAFIPTIPVDAFNVAVWNDVGRTPNPFGTKSYWGSNAQGLTTPAVAAVTSGLVSGAAAARGNADRVSPWEVGLTAAAAGGVGAATGLLIGKTLGALAGLAPDDQQALQRMGLWGGLLSATVGRLL